MHIYFGQRRLQNQLSYLPAYINKQPRSQMDLRDGIVL